MQKLRFIVLMLVTVAIAQSSSAYVGGISLQELVQGSDVIVVARVEAVTPPVADEFSLRIARATVFSVWKGRATLQQVEFVASPTWACDIAEATVGETALLFLRKEEQQSAFVIMHAGRGRMPIDESRAEKWAAIWREVLLPRGAQTQPGPEPEYDFIRSISVSQLEKIVRKYLANATTD